jgi:hypothetical protein
MSKNTENNELCIKLADAVHTNFNQLLTNAGIETQLEFDEICKILDSFMEKINVIKDKKISQYDKCKKRFSKFLNYNTDFIKEHLVLGSKLSSNTNCKNFFEQFNDEPNENWNTLHLVVVSYVSYLKQTNDDKTLNYRGMIDKIMAKIEEFSAEAESESDSECSENEDNESENDNYEGADPRELLNNLKQHLPQTEKAPTVIKGLLGDIKGMLKSTDNMDSKSIVDISRDLSSKYQTMIESGDLDMNDLLSGVFNLLNDPDAINGEFDDIDSSKLPDPSKIISEMSNDPSLKQAMGMLGGMAGKGGQNGMPDMSMLGSMVAGMMGSGLMGDGKPSNNKADPNAPNTVFELEKEIERMMREVELAESENQLNGSNEYNGSNGSNGSNVSA